MLLSYNCIFFRLEQDPESNEKSPTFAMDENIRILEDMRAYFESFTDYSTDPVSCQWYLLVAVISQRCKTGDSQWSHQLRIQEMEI